MPLPTRVFKNADEAAPKKAPGGFWLLLILGTVIAALLYFPPWHGSEERTRTWDERIQAKVADAADADTTDVQGGLETEEAEGPTLREIRLDLTLLGRKFRFVLRSADDAVLVPARDALKTAVEALATELDPTHEGGYLARLHAAAGNGEFIAPTTPDAHRVVEALKRMSAIADHLVLHKPGFGENDPSGKLHQLDLTLGPLYSVWGFYGKNPAVPGAKALAEARSRYGQSHLLARGDAFRLAKPGMAIEVHTVGVPAILFRAAEVARETLPADRPRAYWLYGGRHRVVGGGDGPEGDQPFGVKLNDPASPFRPLLSLRLPPGGEVAYAEFNRDYDAFMDQRQLKGRHGLLDPETGFPGTRSLLTLVVGPDVFTTQGLGRAVFLAGIANGAKPWTPRFSDCAVLSIDADGARFVSPAMMPLVEWTTP